MVYWDGQPQFNNWSILKSATLIMIVYGGLNGIIYFIQGKYWLAVLYLFLTLIFFFIIIRRKNKTRYLITNHRIIFQLPKGRKKNIHSLPLNHLEKVEVKKEGGTDGNIHLTLKAPYKPEFKTINIKYNAQRKLPTLELVEDAEEVAELILNARDGKL